jgi:aryl-alcohol dehydrogenase-like predicted oxidoreductase
MLSRMADSRRPPSAPLPSRTLGSTGVTVTRLGLGLAAVGRPAYINVGRAEDLGRERSVDAMRARSDAVLDAAWSAGIRYLDAARSYGRAEEFLAGWLGGRGIARDAVVVGSKWGYTYVAGWAVGARVNEIKDHSVATLRRQVAESRALLGPWLRLYQIHSATRQSGVLDDPAVARELARLRGEGLAIGLTTSGPAQADTIRRALDVRADGVGLFGAVQATWNLLEPSAGAALAEAHAAGLGVIVKEALANGRLARPASGGPLAAVASSADTGADAVAIAAVLAQPWADVVLSGAVTPEQVEANVAAVALRLEPGALDGLASLAVPAERYWAERSALPWS